MFDMQLTKADFHLPQLSSKLVDIGKEVTHGRGFHLITCVCLHKAWFIGIASDGLMQASSNTGSLELVVR